MRSATGMHVVLFGLVALLLWSPAAGVAAQASGPRYHLLAEVEQSYSSNLFHEQTRRLPLFETLTGPRERYRGMSGPSDFVTEPGLEAGLSFKLGKRRSLGFELGAQYALHARNPVANYLALAAGARYKLGKRDSLSYEAGLIPKRFVKNYPFDGLPSLHQTWFQRADRLELDDELSYRHAWTKRVRSELGLALNLHRFDAPFANRDTNEYAATLSSSYAPSHLLELELGFDFGITRTPDGLEYRNIKGRRTFIPVDRSHHDVEPHLRVVLDLPARFGAAVDFGTRLRKFETDERRDGTYYDRHDLRWKLDAELSKGFGKRFGLTLQAGYQDNNAYRADPDDDADDYGYAELTLALGLSLLLD